MVMLLSDPFEALLGLQQTLDALHDSDWLTSGPSGAGAYPPLNVFRKGDDFVVITEVPGIGKSDIDVQIKDNTIRISGKKAIGYAENAAVHRRERLAGKFDRAVTIPVEIDAERVKAECRDGLLALFLPRAERAKPKTIKIT